LFNYARAAKTATRLIENFGKAGSITRAVKTGEAYNPTLTTTAYPCQLAVTEYRISERDGTMVLMGDKRVFVSVQGVPIEPTVSDRLVIDGESHSIINVMPLKPGPVTVCWEMQVRK
jgi:hypothetical protein